MNRHLFITRRLMNSYAQAVESYAQFRQLLQSYEQGWEKVWEICSKL